MTLDDEIVWLMKPTNGKVVPLIMTPSAKRTRDGLFLNLAFLAALSRADLRVDWKKKEHAVDFYWLFENSPKKMRELKKKE